MFPSSCLSLLICHSAGVSRRPHTTPVFLLSGWAVASRTPELPHQDRLRFPLSSELLTCGRESLPPTGHTSPSSLSRALRNKLFPLRAQSLLLLGPPRGQQAPAMPLHLPPVACLGGKELMGPVPVPRPAHWTVTEAQGDC